jgi:hypothetical protein
MTHEGRPYSSNVNSLTSDSITSFSLNGRSPSLNRNKINTSVYVLGSTNGLPQSLSLQHDEDEYLGEVTNSEYGSSDMLLPESDLIIFLLL